MKSSAYRSSPATTTTTTTSSTASLPLPGLARPLVVLALLAVLAAILPSVHPVYLSSRFSHFDRPDWKARLHRHRNHHGHHHKWSPTHAPDTRHLEAGDCEKDVLVGKVCIQCAENHLDNYNIIYGRCCAEDGDVRQYCRDWYVEDPKTGREIFRRR